MEISVCRRTERRRNIRTHLSYYARNNGTAGALDGACGGQSNKKSAVLAYKTLEKPGTKWHIHGWFAIVGCYLLMMYYTTVSGWMLNYFF